MSPDYGHLVNAVERLKLHDRFEVVCYCVGYYKAVNDEILDMILKLHEDNLIEA